MKFSPVPIILSLLVLSIAFLPVVRSQTNVYNNKASVDILSTDTLPHFREIWVNTVSDVQFYHVSVTALSTQLTIEAEYPLKVSLHCHEDYQEQLVLLPDAGVIDQRIFVKAFPESIGDFSPVIRHTTLSGINTELHAGVTSTAGGAPAGYYASATETGSALKTQLHHLIRNHTVLGYSSLWGHFEFTDVTFDGLVWDIYSDIPCEEPPYVFSFGVDQDTGSGGNQEGDVFNREHTMPLSWFGGSVSPMRSDIYHIYPVDKHVNAVRANYPFGIVNQPTWTSQNGGKLGPNVAGEEYTGMSFEPIDAYKGDLARAFFYMITRYEDVITDWTYSDEGNVMFDHNTYPGFEPWVIEMLLQWHRKDPVSQRERMRNDLIYQLQGNRNPFVDKPLFVEKIWGDPATFTQPLQYENSVVVFPVPAHQQLHFKASQIIEKAVVFSLSGETIKEISAYNYEGSVGLTHILPGMYYIKFLFDESFVVKPFIIK